MVRISKTNAIRILERSCVDYEVLCLDEKASEPISGAVIADKFGRDAERVHKTLVARGSDRQIYVFVLPLHVELDLKRAAGVVGVKNIAMLPHRDLQKLTGYVKGGCSPVGMKKLFPTFLYKGSLQYEKIIVNGGRIGLLVELSPLQLMELIGAQTADFVRPRQ